MAYVIENTYTGDGSTVLFSFTFPYLEKTDVKVSIDQVDTTAFTFANATQIQLNSASGTSRKTIGIYRDTNIDSLKAEFFSGSAIRSQDLNEDFLQTLYSGQESEKAVELKWNKTTETLDSTETFVDSNTHLMTAAAIDDRINANVAVQPLADGKILAGNGSGVAAAVTPSGDVTMANTGAFTIGTGAVEHAMLAGDAVDGDNIGDDVVDSEHIAAGAIALEHMSSASVDSDNIVNDSIVNADINSSAAISHSKLANVTNGQILVGNGSNVPTAVAVSGDITLANTGAVTIANDAVDTDQIADDAVEAAQLGSNAVVNDSVASGAAIEFTKLEDLDSTKILVGNGSNKATEVSMSGDINIATTGATTIQGGAVEIGMLASDLKSTSITNEDTKLPTSGAVVDYVTDALTSAGSFEVIADEDNFPATHPDPKASASVAGIAGMVVSIQNAGGISINSSGVATNARKAGSGSDDITINGFPTSMRGGVGGNADPYVLTDETGLLVTTTAQTDSAYTSGAVYEFHRVAVKPSDYVQLSDDINDFKSRYRVAAAASDVRTGQCGANGTGSGAYPCDGDMYWNTAADKMYVYDKAGGSGTSNSDIDNAWSEVSSVGEFKLLELKDAADDSSPTYDGGNSRSYNLKLLGTSTAASVTNAAQLLISVNGVIQKANSGVSVSGSGGDEGFCRVDSDTIMFATAPASGASVFIVQIGAATDLQVPADDSVSTDKLQTGAVSTAKIGANQVTGDKIAMGSDASGDILYYNGTDYARLGKGSDGEFLKLASGVPSWAADNNDNTQLSTEQVQDIAGPLVATGGTKTGIAVTYDDANNNMDFVVDDTTKLPLAGGTITGPLVINDSVAVEITAATSSTGITLDFGASCHHSVTLAHNTTFADPSNEVVGQSGSIIITQDGTGSRTASWNSAFKWAGGTAPTLSTAANAVDRIDYLVVAAGNIHAVASLDVK